MNEVSWSEEFYKKTESETWYEEMYLRLGNDRNNVLNPEVMMQSLAHQRCQMEAFRNVRSDAHILDVGGGNGAGITRLIEFGFKPERLAMIEIQKGRVNDARRKVPSAVELVEGDASSMPFESGRFDVVTSSTMFIAITDSNVSKAIAQEMLRVTKPGGRLLIFDWRYDGGRWGYCKFDRKRIGELFGDAVKLERTIKGQLVPPLGRALSKRLPSLYFLIQRLPVVTGLLCYELKKVLD